MRPLASRPPLSATELARKSLENDNSVTLLISLGAFGDYRNNLVNPVKQTLVAYAYEYTEVYATRRSHAGPQAPPPRLPRLTPYAKCNLARAGTTGNAVMRWRA